MTKEQAEKMINRYLQPTKRQHFVKRKYLSNWSKDNKTIYCKQKNNSEFIKIGLSDACVKRNFYKIYHHFNEVELFIIRRLFADDNKLVASTCENTLNVWQKQTEATYLLKKIIPEETELIEKFEVQSGEDFQTYYENYFYEIVDDYLSKCDWSFLENESLKAKFCIGLTMQYVRTYGMNKVFADGIVDLLKKYEEYKESINVEQMSLIIGEICSIKMAFMLFLNADSGIELLKNEKNSFLTCDMPVIHIGERFANGMSKELKFLFVVSPKLAFMFPTKNRSVRLLNKEETERINDLVIFNSNELVFRI